LLESEGYCGRHCRDLARFSDGLAVALFYRHLLRQKNKNLGPDRPGFLSRLKGIFNPARPASLCPACHQEVEVEQGQARLMRQAFQEPEFKTAWQAHAGLCLPHITLVGGVDFPGRAEFLKGEATKSEALCLELDEIVRKHDHRSNEKMGKEGDAWSRALRKMHGVKE
jgi:hypothetical protein